MISYPKLEKQLDVVIFDMDGTLLDSTPVWRSLASKYLALRGIETTPQLRKELREIPSFEAAKRVSEELDTTITTEELKNWMRSVMKQAYLEGIPERPGVPEYIAQLHRHGIRTCVWTATPGYMAFPALEKHHLTEGMEFWISSADEGISKNDAASYTTVLQRLGVQPERCALLDDYVHAMEGAHDAGLKVIAMEEKFQLAYYDNIISVCDMYAHNFSELLFD